MKILITGAAGFLGSHLIETLDLYGFEVVALVRNYTDLLTSFNKYKLILPSNIEIIETKDLLNYSLLELPPVDYVIHCAGKLGAVNNKKLFNDNNIILTKKLAEFYKNKLIFISTLSVFVATKNNNGMHLEDDNIDKDMLIGDYAISKAIAEDYVSINGGYIIRPGLLTPSTSSVIDFPNSFLSEFINAIKKINCIPEEYVDASIDITPVNVCSSIIVSYLRRLIRGDTSKILHIANAKSVKLSEIIKQLKLKNKCSKNDFLEHINSVGLNKTQILLLKNAFYKEDLISNKLFNFDLFQSTGHYYGPNCFTMNNELVMSLYIKSIM